ncbi:Variant-specific surface protein [Giardia duodenalis]|uniref:Variant-specific surface protein n=1 Tax=Giardia intestinalis TaxID=5741 RepID=V6TU15_GIAIN|nr:Variant-specific surface protein [Giardia intestinalis]
MLVIYLAVGALADACNSGDASSNCGSANCEMVGTTQICTNCVTGYVPINGKCVAKAASSSDITTAGCKKNDGGEADQTCGQCGAGYFLHKGGCYQIEGTPGSTICTTAGDAGICQDCQAGYFKTPANVETSDSCIACGDTTGVTVSGGATYKGVANCATCTAPQAGGSGGTATCTACVDGKYGDTCATDCDANCKACKGTATQCTSCKDSGNNQYFKEGTNGDGTGTCVAEDGCGNTHFPVAADKKCYPCSNTDKGGIASCQTCSKTETTLKCLTCSDPKKPNTTGTACVACTITDCANCNEENVCEACTNSKKLSPLKDACLDACPAGTYDSQGVCTFCHLSCAECNGNANQDSCTACYPGHVLNKTDSSTAGTCIPECTGRYAENCEAGMCTAVLGGSKYCSRCKSGFVPVDGLCVSAGTRAPPTGCTPGDGVCSSCTGTYFLQSGGCYLSTAYPGKTLCSSAQNGQCQTCANGQTQSSGSCPACDPTCATCETADTKQCKTCFSGYYLDSTAKACKKCSENSADGKITGVPNCVSCKEPSGASGTVTCYVTQSPTVDPTDPSVNKGGLSSGAIAGISVAVIAVVGGLVGFLCWWVVCRGKA